MLKNFIIQEALKSEHAERFILFQERYNTQVLLDLKKALEKIWERDVNSLSKKHKLPEEDLELALLQNPKSTVMLKAEHKDEKLVSSRHRETIEVSPSVKIPLLYKREERDLMTKQFLDAAEVAIKQVADDWREIFRVEKKGRAVPWFKITREKDEIRFQLALTEGEHEMYKTLYAIRIEYGKPGSRLKDFDRIYLVSLI
jgi:hypothetical protein